MLFSCSAGTTWLAKCRKHAQKTRFNCKIFGTIFGTQNRSKTVSFKLGRPSTQLLGLETHWKRQQFPPIHHTHTHTAHRHKKQVVASSLCQNKFKLGCRLIAGCASNHTGCASITTEQQVHNPGFWHVPQKQGETNPSCNSRGKTD